MHRALIRPPDPQVPDASTLVRIGGTYSSSMTTRILFHCIYRDAHDCFDATFGHGGCWRHPHPPGLRVVTNDIDPKSSADLHRDFTNTGLPDGCFDVSLWDPPHLPYLGQRAFMRARYGTASSRTALRTSIEDGAREMWRIARIGMIAKLSDFPNGGAFLPLSHWVIEALGVAPCYIMLTTKWPTPRPPGEVARLPRNNGAVWLAFRRDGQGRDGCARYPDFIERYARQNVQQPAALQGRRR